MRKSIVILGVGSTYFTKGIVESLVRSRGGWDLRLVDIDEECLRIAAELSRRIVEKHKADVLISASTDRCDVLSGADAVVCTIGVGGRKAWEKDVLVFRQFDIHQTTGDTYGAGGVSRALRTIPVLLDIARDVERLCPDAYFVNFTNPMTVNVWALSKHTRVKALGLCYGVTWYQKFLADFIGAPFHETWCKAVGVNHFTWITDFLYQGRNAWPLVEKKLRERTDDKNAFTWELFDAFGAYPCVGDGHICEFFPEFQKKGAYYGKTPGVDGINNFEAYAATWDATFQDMADIAYGKKPLDDEDPEHAEAFKDEDLFIDVLMSLMGEKSVERTVNLPNSGQAPGLPLGAVLEMTTLVNGAGCHPLSYASIPSGISAIMHRVLGVQELTVEAAVRGDRRLAVQALIAGETAVKRADAEKILDAILDTHREYLPRFQ
jgi:alpha-galactosidase